ncbi:MAG: methylated-DNA--[Oscillospiraceae bacterium]|nr:methylated-DNA--[protein]-cysteine S-methyltransferase [Oscillospiraceae bacterium]
MYYSTIYSSIIGDLLVVCDEQNIIGLWMMGQKYFCPLKEQVQPQDSHPLLLKAKNWLDEYFGGNKPVISALPLAPMGSDFRKEVWEILCRIPYGQVMTYGQIADIVAKNHGKEKMSAQAVGGAVGHNPISVIIPCHRVVGTNGSLTGYAGGMDKKLTLLRHEGVDTDRFTVPVKGTAI